MSLLAQTSTQQLVTSSITAVTAQFQTLSTQTFNVSSINGIVPGAAFSGSTVALSTSLVTTSTLLTNALTTSSITSYGTVDIQGNVLSNVGTEYFIKPLYTTTFLPTNISGLKAWFDASKPTSITSNGSGQVFTWSNLAGFANATQAVASNTPVTGQLQINSLNTVQFNPTNEITFGPISYTTAARAVFAVLVTPFNPSVTNKGTYIFGGQDATLGTSGFHGYQFAASGFEFQTSIGGGSGVGYVTYTALANAGAFSATNAWLLSYHPGNGIFVNGTSNSTAANLNTGSFTDLFGSIGQGFNVNTFYVAEFLQYDTTFSLSQRQTVEGYLAWKWGIQSRLNGTHPYLSIAPPPLGITFLAMGGITADTGSNISFSATNKIRLTAAVEIPTTLSTAALTVSSINGQTIGQPIQSTVIGLGTAGYISTSQLYSTVQGIGSGFTGSTIGLSAATINTSTINSVYLSSVQGYVSSLRTDSLTVGGPTGYVTVQDLTTATISTGQLVAGAGFISSLQINTLSFGPTGYVIVGDVIANSLSTTRLNTQALYTNNAYIGNVSSQSAILFPGIDGNYRGTAIAERTTGVGTGELLLYKVSSTTDQIRLQTTGNLVFEVGAPSRSWNSTTQLATPTLYIQGSTSNVGVGTATPATTLDVVGTGRFQTLSSFALDVSSINGAAPGGTFNGSTLALSTGSVYASNVVVKNNGNVGSNTYGIGIDTLTVQTNIGALAGGIASLYFGASNPTYPLARIGAVDYGVTYGNSALVFQTATPANASLSGVITYSYSNANQSFTVPSGITSVTVYMWGAGGGGGNGTGGAGAFIQGTLAVTPGNTLTVIVGGGGVQNGGGTFGGGGSSGQQGSASGGGRSAIQLSGTELVDVGGGGGGSYSGFQGGAANYSPTINGGAGYRGAQATFGGFGGTQTAGGAVVTGPLATGTAGSSLQGGAGGQYSGGGGGGFYGGGGGSTANNDGCAGGGGSSYTTNAAFTLITGSNSPNTAAQAPATASPYYASGAAAGATGGNTGGNGLVVIVYNPPYNLSETMRISQTGNIGIGTSSPQALLHVSGMTYSIQTSTQALTVSSINGAAPWQPSFLTSTVQGLGTAGYISTAAFQSTVTGINYAISQNTVDTVFYLNPGTAATTYRQMSPSQTTFQQSTMTTFITRNTSNIPIAQFQTDFTVPQVIPDGAWDLNLFAYTDHARTYIYTSLFSRAGATETLIASSSNATTNIGTSPVQQYTNTLFVPQTIFTSTTGVSLVLKVFANNPINQDDNLYTYYQGGTYSHTHTTFGTVVPDTLFTSTVAGLGTAGYVSTLVNLRMISSLEGYVSSFRTDSLTVGGPTGFVTVQDLTTATISTGQIVAGAGFISSLQINSLSFGPTGYVIVGDVIANSLSTTRLNTQALYANNAYIGNVSSQSAILFPGIDGTYKGTAIAERTTGVGTQELLLYKVSSTTDQIRLQTTGNIVFEAGAASRSWNSTTQLATPTLYIAGSTSNVGIGTAAPATTLDVVGTGRFQVVSSFALNVSSINGAAPGGTFNGSTLALSTASVYTSSLTTNALQVNSYINAQGGTLSNVGTEYFTVSKYTTTFSPLLISGCILWLDAQDPFGLSTQPANGTSLTSVKDKSPSNFPLTSPGTIFTTNVINGLPGLNIGSNANDNRPIGFNPGSAQNNFQEVFIVALWVGGSTFNSYNGLFTNHGGDYGLLGNPGGTNFITSYITTGSIHINGIQTTTALPTILNPFIVRAYNSSAVNLQGILFGWDRNNAGRSWIGYIGEAICYNTALTNSQREQVEGYLAWKWGINSVFPIQYTYYNTPPPPFGTVYLPAGSITTDTGSNLTIRATAQTSINFLGNVQVASTLTVSTVSTFLVNAQTISTPSLQVSSINGAAPWQPSFLTSTVQALTSNISSMIDPTELTSSIVGLGTAGFISTVGLTYAVASTAQGLGTFGYTSTNQLLSTTIGVYGAIGSNIATTVQPQFASTVMGLGTVGYVSTAFTGSTTSLSAATIVVSSLATNSAKTSSLTMYGTLNMSNNLLTNIYSALFAPTYSGNPNNAAGGIYTIYTSGSIDYAVHAFKTVGTTTFTANATITGAQILVVGGGGSGGGGASSGGGGAGGLVYATGITITPAIYSIVVGGGGVLTNNPNYNTPGVSGSNSSALGYTGNGGGAGGSDQNHIGANGGCGGGGCGLGAFAGGTGSQGFAGGTAVTGDAGAGGGGMGSIGSVNSGSVGGAGGSGVTYSITGTATGYAAGGGGSSSSGTTPVLGGSANGTVIGGYGGASTVPPTAGAANTGSGGGGQRSPSGFILPGAGGSGIVIIAYPLNQYSYTPYTVGTITGDATSNLSIQPVNNLNIVGITQTSALLVASTFSTTFINATTISTPALNVSTINGAAFTAATPFTGSTLSLSTASIFTSSLRASTISVGGGAWMSNDGLYLSNAQAGGAVGKLVTHSGYVKLMTATAWNGGYGALAITGGDLTPKVYMGMGTSIAGGNLAIGGLSPSPGAGITLDVFGAARFSSISTFQAVTSSIGVGMANPIFPLDVAGLGRFQILSTLALNVSSINGQSYAAPFQSTTEGLGTLGYISSTQLGSTVTNLITRIGAGGGGGGTTFVGSTTFLSATQILFSTQTGYNISSVLGFVSSLQVDELQIGTGFGIIAFGDTNMSSISTLGIAAGLGNFTTINVSSINGAIPGTGSGGTTFTGTLGTVSSLTALRFFGLTGTYANTAVAEVSTGTGLQELLLYKVSSVSDQVRVQTTGNVIFETGVGARSWPTASRVLPPTLYIAGSNSNVGIGTSNPVTALDVAGTGRFQTLSSLNITAGSINYSVAFV